MFTRDDNLYLKLILKTLGCKNISILAPDEKSDDLICGFSSLSTIIGQDIARIITPQQTYRASSSQYIAIFSKRQLIDFLLNKFIEHTRALLANCDGDYDREFGFIFSNQAACRDFLGRPRNTALAKLREAGIDYGDYSERIITPGFGFPFAAYPFAGFHVTNKDYHFLRAFDVVKFFEKTCPVDLQKKQERAERQTFLNGMESKSSALHCFKNQSKDYKNVTKLVLQFHSTKPPVKSFFNAQDFRREKTTDAMNVNNLMNMMDLLNIEIKEEEDTLKKDKVAFLKLVLALKRANTYFGLSDCLSIAKQMKPALYNQAIAGYFSRTRKVLDEIETKRCGFSL